VGVLRGWCQNRFTFDCDALLPSIHGDLFMQFYVHLCSWKANKVRFYSLFACCPHFLLCSLRLKMALGLIYFVVADWNGGKVKKGVAACVGILEI
jgi:hypothetical protein